MGTLDNLYPPVINSYMPAFIISPVKENDKNTKHTGTVRVYFSISKYNSLEDIKQVWVSVNDQFTNKNLVNTERESKSNEPETKTGFILFNRKPDEDKNRNSDDKYYIEFSQEYLLGETWEKDKCYKVQIRFSDITLESPEENLNTNSAIIKYSDYFSEWSTVCLLHPILKPELSLKGFNDKLETVFSSMDNSICGKIKFSDKERLDSYRIRIFKRGESESDFDSGDIMTGSVNSESEINYSLKYGFLDGEHYILNISYLTKNLYYEEKEFNFLIIDPAGKTLNANLYVTPENDLGRIKINLHSDEEYYFGNITIRRTSSRSNFLIWEDIHNFTINSAGFVNYTWYDYSVESGVWYRYCAQKRSSYGDRGPIVKGKERIEFPETFARCKHNEIKQENKPQSMVYLNDMFLSGEDNQHLKIKFDPQITSFTHTVLDSSVQAIGSKYPFIRRNADVNYRQFPISGLISYHMDDGNLFTSKENLLNNNVNLYEEYNEKQNISNHKDFTLEREFRNKVKDFLYNGKVKLFKSASEGNILVRLMNISLSPKAELGRMIYSFSATAYEIDDLTLENLDKYNIQNIGSLQEIVLSSYEKFKENTYRVISGETDLISLIEKEEQMSAPKDIIRKVSYLKNFDIEIQGIPHPIKVKEDGDIEYVDKNSSIDTASLLGYIIEINGENIYVNKDGIFKINPETGLKINSLKVLVPTGKEFDVIIHSTLSIEEKEDQTKVPDTMTIYRRVGQIDEIISPKDDLMRLLFEKYYSFNSPYYKKLLSINTFRIETEPYTIFTLKDSSQDKAKDIMIGETGVLVLEEEDYMLESLKLKDGNKTTRVLMTYTYDLEEGSYREKIQSEVS